VSHEQHTYLVTDVAMTSDNRKVVSCAWDGRLLVTGLASPPSHLLLVFVTLLTPQRSRSCWRGGSDVASGETKSLNLHAKLGQMQLITDRVLAVADVMCAVSFVDLDTMEFLRGYEVSPRVSFLTLPPQTTPHTTDARHARRTTHDLARRR
jgi:hypothetical protein